MTAPVVGRKGQKSDRAWSFVRTTIKAISNVVTSPYYRFYRQNTLLPILRLAKSVEERDSADLISQRLHQWQTRKLDEYRFVQLSVCGIGSAVLSLPTDHSFQGSLLAAAVIGSFSWPIPTTIHWLGPASWYASLIMSFCAVLLSSSEHFLYATTRDHTRHPDLRRRLNMFVRISGGGPGDLLLSAAPSQAPAVQPQQAGQGMTGPARGQGSATSAAPLRAEVRWNMVFTWQAPMMLLSYSLIAFIMGLSLCVLTPPYDGRDYDDGCKIAILYIVFSIFAGSVPYSSYGSPSCMSWNVPDNMTLGYTKGD